MSLFYQPSFWLPALVEVPLGLALLTQFLRHNSWLRQKFNLFGTIAIVLIKILGLISLKYHPNAHASSWIVGHCSYHCDRLSSIFICLSIICVLLTLYYQQNDNNVERSGHHTALLWWLMALMHGFFLIDHLLGLFVFFEASLIPLFYWISAQDNQQARHAAVKMFLYTAAGSALLLISLMLLCHNLPLETWQISRLSQPGTLPSYAAWIPVGFLIAFLVKIPLWPLHAWLPHAHTQAPASASVLLAALMLKMGGYGMMRVVCLWFPQSLIALSPALYTASLISIVLISLIAWGQSDLKKMVAYSSISHMGFVVLVLTMTAQVGADVSLCWEAATMQMVSHGLISAALFFCVGFLYERFHTRDLSVYGGLGSMMPWMTTYMTFFLLANAGVPGLSGFMGELSTLVACYPHIPEIVVLVASSMVLSAMINLRILIDVFYGPLTGKLPVPEKRRLVDCRPYEHHILLSLAAGVLLLGLYPGVLWDWLAPQAHNAAMIVAQHHQGGV